MPYTARCMTRRSPIRALPAEPRRRLLALAVGAGAAFFVLALLAQLRLLIEVEWQLQSLAQATRTPALEQPMRAISLLGNGWVLGPVAAAGCLVVRARHARLSLAVVGVLLGALLTAHLSKVLVIRQRPNTVLWAYPSAHTFGIVVFVILLLYVLWAVGTPALGLRLALATGMLLVLAVGASRVYLNAHWIGDVLGGLTSGLAFAVAGVLLIDRRIETVTG